MSGGVPLSGMLLHFNFIWVGADLALVLISLSFILIGNLFFICSTTTVLLLGGGGGGGGRGEA